MWEDARTLFGDSGLRAVAVYGGVGYGAQVEALRAGAHVVIGTPGRVLDHLLKATFTLAKLRALVFDEADHILSMGFYPAMIRLRRYLPRRALHTCMFSATFPAFVLRTAHEFIDHPEFVNLSSDHVHVSDVEHVYYVADGMDKDRGLVRLIEIENPTSAIIFCNTKNRVHYISVVLQRFGYDADELSSDLTQAEREKVLERVRRGTLRFLVATDVAARGLDVPDLSELFDPRLGFGGNEPQLTDSDALILNIDYPLGLSAYDILSEVSSYAGSIEGVYVMGKAATLNAVIGDVMISNVVHDEHSQNTYLFPNCFTAADVAPDLVYGTVLDNQTSITVQGTFLQNARYIDVFYREGYTVIEMEAGPYLSAIYEMYRPQRHPVNEIVNLYELPFDLGIAHYVTDTPLSKGRNLGAGSLSYYGMDSTYAVSLAVLRHIFRAEQKRLARQK